MQNDRTGSRLDIKQLLDIDAGAPFKVPDRYSPMGRGEETFAQAETTRHTVYSLEGGVYLELNCTRSGRTAGQREPLVHHITESEVAKAEARKMADFGSEVERSIILRRPGSDRDDLNRILGSRKVLKGFVDTSTPIEMQVFASPTRTGTKLLGYLAAMVAVTLLAIALKSQLVIWIGIPAVVFPMWYALKAAEDRKQKPSKDPATGRRIRTVALPDYVRVERGTPLYAVVVGHCAAAASLERRIQQSEIPLEYFPPTLVSVPDQLREIAWHLACERTDDPAALKAAADAGQRVINTASAMIRASATRWNSTQQQVSVSTVKRSAAAEAAKHRFVDLEERLHAEDSALTEVDDIYRGARQKSLGGEIEDE